MAQKREWAPGCICSGGARSWKLEMDGRGKDVVLVTVTRYINNGVEFTCFR